MKTIAAYEIDRFKYLDSTLYKKIMVLKKTKNRIKCGWMK